MAGVGGAFALALAVGGASSAVAAPTSAPIESMQDLKGAWLTSLTGFQDADPISWQHRMIVRKVKGQAAVAWEEWRDCAEHAVACRTGKASGGGWSAPSRVLLAMNAKGVVHGVGATGTVQLTPGETGMNAVMLGFGQRQEPLADPAPATAALSAVVSIQERAGGPSVNMPYAATGSSKWYPDW